MQPAVLGGVKAFILQPKEVPAENSNRLLVHVHGGGYVYHPGEGGYERAVEDAYFVLEGCITLGWEEARHTVEERLGPKDVIVNPAGRAHYFRHWSCRLKPDVLRPCCAGEQDEFRGIPGPYGPGTPPSPISTTSITSFTIAPPLGQFYVRVVTHRLRKLGDGGTANIAFLQGAAGGPNAQSAQVDAILLDRNGAPRWSGSKQCET